MCSCHGIKLIAIGGLLVVNDQGWLWNPMSAWLLIGEIMIVLGLLKAWKPGGCPVHNKGVGMKPMKKGK